MIGLDSSAIIDFFRGNESLKELLINIREPLATNEISYFELIIGLDSSNRKHMLEEEFYDNFFQSLTNFSLDRRASKNARDIFVNLKKIGKIIEQFDCAIAGIYLSNGISKIITRNVEHFNKIAGLKVLSY